MTSLLDLPEEILLDIFFRCDFKTQIQLLQTCHRMYAVRYTPKISYQLACRFCGLEPVFEPDCELTFQQREKRVLDREEAWWFFQPKWEYAIEADPSLPSRIIDPDEEESDDELEDQYLSISGDIFSFGSANSMEEMRKTPAIWKATDRRIQNHDMILNPNTRYLVEDGSFIQDVVLCHKQDLMLVLERFHDTFSRVRIRFMKISEPTSFHEEATQRMCEGHELLGVLPEISPADDDAYNLWPMGLPADPVVAMSIVGKILLSHVGETIKIWLWRTMTLVLEIDLSTSTIASCLLSDSQCILLGSNLPKHAPSPRPDTVQLRLDSWHWNSDSPLNSVVRDSSLLFPSTSCVPDRLRFEAEVWAEPLMENNRAERIGKYERLNLHDGVILIKMSYAGEKSSRISASSVLNDSEGPVKEETCIILRKSLLSEFVPSLPGGSALDYPAWAPYNITIFPSTIPSSVYPVFGWRVVLHDEIDYNSITNEDIMSGKPLFTQNFRVYDFSPMSVKSQVKFDSFGNWLEFSEHLENVSIASKKVDSSKNVSQEQWLSAIWSSDGGPPNELELRLIKLSQEIFGKNVRHVLGTLRRVVQPCISFVVGMVKGRMRDTHAIMTVIEASRSVPSQFLRTLLRISLSDSIRYCRKVAVESLQSQLDIIQSLLHKDRDAISPIEADADDECEWQEISMTGVNTATSSPLPHSDEAIARLPCMPHRWIENSGHLEAFFDSSISVNLMAERALMEYGYEFGSELYSFAS